MNIPKIINKAELAAQMFPNSTRPRQLLYNKENNISGARFTEADLIRIKTILKEQIDRFVIELS